MGDIVVGVDGSANGAAALRWAVAEAALRTDRVVALFAWGYIPPGHAGDGRTFDPEYGSVDADAALVAAVEAAVGPERAGGIERQVIGDVPTKALLAASAGAELLVVGARGIGGFQRLLLGSVSEGCLHHATRPLAIIRSAAPPEPAAAGGERQTSGPARIVVGVDGSDSARRAMRWALEEARLRRAAVDVVHAWHVPYTVHSPFAGIPIAIEVVEKSARGPGPGGRWREPSVPADAGRTDPDVRRRRLRHPGRRAGCRTGRARIAGPRRVQGTAARFGHPPRGPPCPVPLGGHPLIHGADPRPEGPLAQLLRDLGPWDRSCWRAMVKP